MGSLRTDATEMIAGARGGTVSRIARTDDEERVDEVPRSVLLDEVEREACHVDLPEVEIDDEDATDGNGDGSFDELVEAFVEAYNGHDLDAMIALFAEDVELPGIGTDADGFAAAISDVWERRSTSILTRGVLDDTPAAVFWDVNDEGQWDGPWRRLAFLTFEPSDDGESVGLIELVDDGTQAEDVVTSHPEPELAEGSRWAEWYEGDGE
ncbi:MAG: nuclear transport factor 2 family protein [Nitriliruptorales bacterium]